MKKQPVMIAMLAVALSLLVHFSVCAQDAAGKPLGQTFCNTEFHPAYTPSFEVDGAQIPVRNIILMIGDGMGLTHVVSAMYANRNQLTMTNLKHIGFVRTQSLSDFTTDSAASGTAYATGVKTKNGCIGVDSLGNPLKNLPEKLAPLGYACGVITTDNMDGATPAAFYAHRISRNMFDGILDDLPDSKLTLFAGGSREKVNSTRPELWDELQKAGYTVVSDHSDCAAIDAPKLGILPPAARTASIKENRGDFLPATTAFALPYLASKSSKGFFIMIEGARIDKSSHNMDFSTSIRETLDFDLAVEAAIRFAEKEGNTLVIISADHETGGLSMGTRGDITKGEVEGFFRSGVHSPVMVPLFAYGPHADMFTGIQENNEVSEKILWLLSRCAD